MYSCLSYSAKDYLPGDGVILIGLGPPVPTGNHDSLPQTQPQATLLQAILQLALLFLGESRLPRQLKFTTPIP